MVSPLATVSTGIAAAAVLVVAPFPIVPLAVSVSLELVISKLPPPVAVVLLLPRLKVPLVIETGPVNRLLLPASDSVPPY